MKIIVSECTGGKCHLSLPQVVAESADEAAGADLMNSFFEKLKDEIVTYCKGSSEVRRYTAEFTCDTAEGTVSIAVKLSARKSSQFGTVTTAKREVFTGWRGTALEKFTFRDL